MPVGLVLKGVGSFYTVLQEGAGEFVCKACGRFRKDGTSPVPGDRVEFALNQDGTGYIVQILPRSNIMVRPAAANLDKLIIVFSAGAPLPDYVLVDKLVVQCELLGILPVLVLNKVDAAVPGAVEEFFSQYRPTGYSLIAASAHTGEGVERIEQEIAGSVCCFAGQSAVGKTSILNTLLPGLELAVGGLSQKTERGRHTTRHAQLWPAHGGAVLDTPGFSLLELPQMEPWELCKLYPEMRAAGELCRFSECAHVSEPGCAVKPLLNTGLSQGRYFRYCQFVEELKEMRKHRYD